MTSNSYVPFVVNHLPIRVFSTTTRERTQIKDLLAVLNVTRSLQQEVIWRLMKEHIKKKNLLAVLNDKKCTTSDNLKTYERALTNKKPFSCFQCDKKIAKANPTMARKAIKQYIKTLPIWVKVKTFQLLPMWQEK